MDDFTQNASGDLLQQGLAAAKAGNTAIARTCFLKAAEEDPSAEMVWICLAAIEPRLPQKFRYLRRATVINPQGISAQTMIKAARKQLSQALMDHATSQVDKGNREGLQDILLAATELDPENTTAATMLLELAVDRRGTPADPVQEPENQVAENSVSENHQGLSAGFVESVQVVDNAAPEEPASVRPSPVPDEPSVPLFATTVEPQEFEITADSEPYDAPPEDPPAVPAETSEGHTPSPGKLPACLFCSSELLHIGAERCHVCGGFQSLFDSRENENVAAIDQRQIIAAVNRIAYRVRANPQDAELHYALGLAYLNLGRTGTALEYFTRSHKLKPQPFLAEYIARSSAASTLETIPAETKPAEANSAEVPAKKQNRSDQARTERTILVAEDSGTMRQLIASALEKAGYVVVAAADGAEALTKFRQTPIDLVLLDVVMPNMDGYQVCRAIRASNKEIPIVLLSARDGFFDKFRGKVAGCTAYLTKPFLREELVASVQQFCPLNDQQEIFQS